MQTREAVEEPTFWHCKQISFSSKLSQSHEVVVESFFLFFFFQTKTKGTTQHVLVFLRDTLLLFLVSLKKKHIPNILVPLILSGVSTIFPLSFSIAEKSYLEIKTFFFFVGACRERCAL